jgi:stage IV sporulation protein B
VSINNIYAESQQKDSPEYLVPIGNVLQIDAELKNIIVSHSVDGSSLKPGDVLMEINGQSFDGFKDFADRLSTVDPTKDVSITLNRNGQTLSTDCKKEILEKVSFNNLLSGFATLTYVDPDSLDFGAVGHPISICNSRKIPIKDGSISSTTDLSIEKSLRGNVGSINAKKLDVIGTFNQNTDFGIRGKMDNFDLSDLPKYKVAELEDVKPGKAQIILSTKDDKPEKFDIEILSVENQDVPRSKSFKIKVTDKDLLKQTGGIVQGMSGTPIIQGDKIIGAVSHALENDPTVGYGIYIKWMF